MIFMGHKHILFMEVLSINPNTSADEYVGQYTSTTKIIWVHDRLISMDDVESLALPLWIQQQPVLLVVYENCYIDDEFNNPPPNNELGGNLFINCTRFNMGYPPRSQETEPTSRYYGTLSLDTIVCALDDFDTQAVLINYVDL